MTPDYPRDDDGRVDVDALLQEMTLAEKAGQCAGTYVGELDDVQRVADVESLVDSHHLGAVTPFGWAGSPHVDPHDAAAVANRLQRYAVEETRLGIPLLVPVDAVHGHAYVDRTTVFPQNLALAATFSPALAERVGEVTAREARATGVTTNYGPTCDVARDPRWGRTFETFGESPFLVSAMAAAKARGLQGDGLDADGSVAATAKHFPAYGGPLRGEDASPVEVSLTEFHRLFVPPFVAALDAGVASVMPCYNSIDGEPAHGSPRFVRGLLRERLGFDGVVASDWNGVEMLHADHRTAESSEEAVGDALVAGVDVGSVNGARHAEAVVSLVREGELDEVTVDAAVRRILALKRDLGLFDDPLVDEDDLDAALRRPEAVDLARDVAREGVTLLENDGLLPLDSDAHVLLTGPNADDLTAQVGGWSVLDPSEGTTLRAGVEAASEGTVTYEPGATHRDAVDIESAAAAARDADVAVVALGEGWYLHEFGPSEMSGSEPGAFPSRHDFGLPDAQSTLLRAIHDTGTPTVLALVSGRPLPIPWAAEHLPAIVFTPPGGTEGGAALADVLFGAEPGGSLPISVARSAAHLPTHHDYVRHPHPIGDHEHPPSYDPLYAFGHGLSYADVAVTDATLSTTTVTPGEPVTVSATVENRGDSPGSQVVQAYLRDEYASRARPVRELCGFERVDLDPGATTTVDLVVSPSAMAVVDSDGARTIEPGEFTLSVGLSATDAEAVSVGFVVE
ncbi:glycoside hydrolase family 3 N-terminal domain-containing protein [Salinigranum marinum]|uniref:glycoside hydrolase family 3 N-terminal domain-containing protein n=1 Tax=Salinigranum marinum TaxID=1515595 RepID=UPI002989DE48|nr:glycoside hydrolase family 3 N-terminal domain-containing protein [Salinigranum marinum]